MMRRCFNAGLALVLGVAIATAGYAQGTQTGTLTGNVKSGEGEALPGVTVTITSSSAIGEKVAVTGGNGDYIFKNLPPGVYKILFALEGMQSVERSANVPLGGTARSDASLEFSTVSETIVITGEAPSALETTTTGANFEAATVNALPVARNLSAVADMAGGLTDNGTVAGQVSIAGSFGYDNIFLVNGVDIGDRAFGTSNDLLVIEEAIEETQVLTNGVSAEFGRFSGGVINAITKSGGNQFTGSFRTDFNRPEWRDETPFEDARGTEREGDLSKIYSATLGGPILRDRLWFFAAGRDVTADTAFTLPITGYADTNTNEQQRLEFKLTGNITPNHSLQGSYTDSESVNSLERQVTPLERAAISENSTRENDAFVVAYNGVFTNSLFGELRYSEKHFGFRGLGGTGTAISDSVFLANGARPGTVFGSYNAPYFDATDPEDRDNEQLYGALSYFLSTESMGSHDLKVGLEIFNDIGVGGNSQSSTGFVVGTDFLTTDDGDAVYDAAGNLIPVWDNPENGYYTYMQFWLATRGATNEIETTSFFINDRWSLNEHFSFNLGVRYEDIQSKSESGIPTIGSDSIVPRLGASYDVMGDGKYKFDVTYSEYSGKATSNQFGAISPAGNPALAYGYYVGPQGLGTNFAPGYDLNNYVFFYYSVPTQTKDIDQNLKTPRTREFSTSFGTQLGTAGYMKLIYVNRDMTDFIETFVDRTSRLVAPTVGPIVGDLTEVQQIRNSDVPERTYQSVQLQGQYRVMDPWTIGGNWTYELDNDGNFEGEVGQSPAIDSLFGDFPEVYSADRNYPTGRLDNFQEHKIRLWSTYMWDLGRAGNLDFGLIGRYDSALTHSFSAANFPLTAQQRVLARGYRSIGAAQTLFFGERGIGEFDDIYSLDLSVQYAIPVWKTLAPWVKFSVTNVTNESNLVTYNTTVRANTAAGAPRDALGLPTTYTLGPTFGNATSSASYQVPMEYFIAAGIRF